MDLITYQLKSLLHYTLDYLGWCHALFLSLPPSSQALFLCVLLPIAFFVIIFFGKSKKNKKHSKNIKAASKSLKKIKKMIRGGKAELVFPYLQKSVCPYVFEELVLTSFKQYGAKIYRSNSYSGDGGVDGAIKLRGDKYLIQSKKYTGYVKAADTQRHVNICSRRKVKGFFIHCGISGRKSISNVSDSPVLIICGDKLIDFFKGSLRI